MEVVISGLSGRLPESDNIAEFRENLFNEVDMVTENSNRWEPGIFMYNVKILLSWNERYCMFIDFCYFVIVLFTVF